MSILMHTRGPFEWACYSSEGRDRVGARPARAYLAMIKRFCLCALAAVLAGGAVAVIMAIKVAAVLWRLKYS